MRAVLLVAVLLGTPLAGAADASPASLVSAVTPVEYVSQLSEPAPTWWRWVGTPYCAAAASLMVMSAFGVQPAQSLASTFEIGRAGNTTNDEGIDPDGIAHLMRTYGGSGRIHTYADQGTALDHLIGRLNHGAPVVVLTKSGWHTVVAYGYEAVAGGPVTAIYAADPLNGHNGKVPIDRWLGDTIWWGGRFNAPGDQWRGAWVFVSYHDQRAAATTAAAPVPAPAPVPVTYASRYVPSGAPDPVVAPGAVADVHVFVRNAGTATWVRGTATEARLGVQGDDTSFHAAGAAVDWPLPSRPAVQSQAAVRPGEIATFMFRVRGTAAGAYLLQLRPVIDGLAWLNDDGIRVVVTIR